MQTVLQERLRSLNRLLLLVFTVLVGSPAGGSPGFSYDWMRRSRQLRGDHRNDAKIKFTYRKQTEFSSAVKRGFVQKRRQSGVRQARAEEAPA
jgi:hypothetical protein